MTVLRETKLADASVPRSASFLDAARALFRSGVSAIAVLDEEQRVIGLFVDDDLLRGLFPGYIGELHHTAFLRRETKALAARLEKASGDRIDEHMRSPVTLDIESSAAHVAERFLHCPWGALAVVEGERFVGMLDQLEFVEVLMRRLEEVDQ